MNESAIELSEASPSVGEASAIDLETLLCNETETLNCPTETARGLLPSVVIGTLVGLDETGAALVDFPENPTNNALRALATVAISDLKVGRNVALLFQNGDPGRPLIVGLLQNPDVELSLFEPAPNDPTNAPVPPVQAEVDRERLVLTADKEIVLRCGKASITLTRAGKILLRGAYLLSRSSGVNRIKGGSVQIN